jgi:hypothetical protein
VRRTQRGRDPALALLSALMLAIYPQAVVYSRFGFSYNLLPPLVLLANLGCWEYLSTARRRWLALVALSIGLGGASDLWMFTLVAPLALVVLKRNWHDLLWSLPLTLLPFGLYAVAMLATAPEAFVFDLNFTLFRLSKLSLPAQIRTLTTNYSTLIFQDTWIALGLVGLFLVRPARLRRLSLLLFLLPILILGRTTALYSLGFYYMIPLMPFVGMGVAALLRYGVPYVWRSIHGSVATISPDCTNPQSRNSRFGNRAYISALFLLLVIATPFATSLAFTVEQVQNGFHTQIDPFLVDPDHARQAAEFVNRHTAPDDVVIASPTLAWLLDANVADVQMATVTTGHTAPDLPAGISTDRFAFDPGYRQARFVIVDNLWHNWAVWNVPGAPAVLREVETWSLVFEAGEIKVYENQNR